MPCTIIHHGQRPSSIFASATPLKTKYNLNCTLKKRKRKRNITVDHTFIIRNKITKWPNLVACRGCGRRWRTFISWFHVEILQFFISVSFCFDCNIVKPPLPLRKKELLGIQFSMVPTICSVGRQRLISSPKPPKHYVWSPK